MQALLQVVALAALAVLVLAALYRRWWHQRFGGPLFDSHIVRLQGRASAVAGAGVLCEAGAEGELARGQRFELVTPDGRRYRVEPQGAALPPRCIVRHRDPITVDAMLASVPRGESLYREPGLEPAVLALRISPGVFPELRRPLRAVMLLAAGTAVAAMIAGTQLVKRPGSGHDFCPPGVVKRGGRPPAKHFEWCELGDRGVKLGPYVMWSEDGRFRVVEGAYYHGRRQGPWRTRYPGGALATLGEYTDDHRTGVWQRWSPEGRLLARQTYNFDGEPHGSWATWHANGRQATLLELVRGKRHGRWRRWNDRGLLEESRQYVDGALVGD